MSYRPVILGIASSLALFLLLAMARRQALPTEEPDLVPREVDAVWLEPPPPPKATQKVLPERKLPELAPANPVFSDVKNSLSDVSVPAMDVPTGITADIGEFHIDRPPAPMPEPTPSKARLKSYEQDFFKEQPNYQPAAAAEKPKSHYSTGELDRKPGLLRHGSTSFPSILSKQGITTGTVVLEIEISTSGKVSVRKVISSTHPELIPAAKRVANGSRFSAPKRRGAAVNAILRWPIIIQK